MLYTAWWDVCQQLLMPHTHTHTHTVTETHPECPLSMVCRCATSESSVFSLFVSPIYFHPSSLLPFTLSLSLSVTSLAVSHAYCHCQFHSHARCPLLLSRASQKAVALRRSAQSTLICNPRKLTQASIQSTRCHSHSHSHSQRQKSADTWISAAYFTFRFFSEQNVSTIRESLLP